MSGYGAKEARINRERRPESNECGGCGKEISRTELLCTECRGTTYPTNAGEEADRG